MNEWSNGRYGITVLHLTIYNRSEACKYKYLSAVLMILGLQSGVLLQTDFSLLLAEHLETPMDMNAEGLPFLVMILFILSF
jgi:hypothetical protein